MIRDQALNKYIMNTHENKTHIFTKLGHLFTVQSHATFSYFLQKTRTNVELTNTVQQLSFQAFL